MGWACEVIDVELGKLEWLCTIVYGECDELLGCLQVRYTDVIANGNSNGNGDDEQRVEAIINATKSRRGSYYDWEFPYDYCV